eukprot:GHVN01012259.1.p1 GENE.GHVN01012259.1~~GHVN01012259.1.p1  ORF type:complete len:1051 (-),score=214.76 GHVN01012259.1:674-3826(-)
MAAPPMTTPSELSNHIQQTLLHDVNAVKGSEQALLQLEKAPNFVPEMLKLIHSPPSQELSFQLATAIYFKNYVRRLWDLSAEQGGMSVSDRETLKTALPTVMMEVGRMVQKQMGEVVRVVGVTDFPEQWQSLLQVTSEEMKKHLTLISASSPTPQNQTLDKKSLHSLEAILKTFTSVCSKFKSAMRSNEVLRELKTVLDSPHLLTLLTEIAKVALGAIVGPEPLSNLPAPQQSSSTSGGGAPTASHYSVVATDLESLRGWFEIMSHCVELFHSLNVVDLPEYFEDNMNVWMSILLSMLSWSGDGGQRGVLAEKDHEASSCVVQELKAEVCECLKLYADKYQSEFQSFVTPAMQAVLVNILPLPMTSKNDAAVIAGLRFVSSCAFTNWEVPHNVFDDEAMFSHIVNVGVIPNVNLSLEELNMMEDDPQEFIRRDIEGNENFTRRSAAMTLIRALNKSHDKKITTLLSSHVTSLLQASAASGTVPPPTGMTAEQWSEVMKTAAIFLITALSIKSATRLKGVSEVRGDVVDVVQFFNTHLASELSVTDTRRRCVVRSATLKFIATFRNQFSREQLTTQLLPVIASHLKSPQPIIHTYAASCIDRLCSSKDKLDPIETKPVLKGCLTSLMSRINEQSVEWYNEHLIKCLLEVLLFLKQEARDLGLPVLTSLVALVRSVSDNPTNPHFNQYLFEALTAVVRISAPHHPAEVENAVLETLVRLIQQDLHDFVPYSLQVLGVLLDVTADTSATAHLSSYSQLFTLLLERERWTQSTANVPGIVRLFAAYFRKHAMFNSILTANMEAILERFQYCLNHNKLTSTSFTLISDLVHYTPLTLYQSYFKMLLTVLLAKIQQKKTEILSQRIALFLSLFCCKADPKILVTTLNEIQAGLASQLYRAVICPSMCEMVEVRVALTDRKLCMMGLARVINTQEVASDLPLFSFCVSTMAKMGKADDTLVRSAVASKLEDQKLEENTTAGDNETNWLGDHDSEFQGVFTKLKTARMASTDRLQDITDIAGALRQHLTSPVVTQTIQSVNDAQLIADYSAITHMLGG